MPSLVILTIRSFQKNIPFLRRYPSIMIDLSYFVLICSFFISSCASFFFDNGEFSTSFSIITTSEAGLVKRGAIKNFTGVEGLFF